MVSADSLIPPAAGAVHLQDSVIAGDVTIHQADANEIARVVDQTGRCPNCGEANANIYSCASTDCSILFCFKCMQQYLHGRTILEHKLCKEHHEMEIRCLPLDEQFTIWEMTTAKAINSLESAKSFENNANTLRYAGIAVGITCVVLGFFGVLEMIGVGIVTALLSLFLPSIASSMVSSSTNSIESQKQNMPLSNLTGRPVISGRLIPQFTSSIVQELMYGK